MSVLRMRSVHAIILSALLGSVSSQSTPPAQGIQLSTSRDVRFPANVSQCEPVLVFYDRATATDSAILGFYAPEDLEPTARLIRLSVPPGTGYIEWICNIPSGYGFVAHFDAWHHDVVRSGASFCLGDVTTTYSALTYSTGFPGYTNGPPNTVAPSITPLGPSVPFPTGTYSTITANPDLFSSWQAFHALSSSSRPSSSSLTTHTSSVGPPPPPTATRKSKTAAIVGGVVGGVALLSFISCLIMIRRRRRRPVPRRMDIDGFTIRSDPTQYSSFVGSRPGTSIDGPGMSRMSSPISPDLGNLVVEPFTLHLNPHNRVAGTAPLEYDTSILGSLSSPSPPPPSSASAVHSHRRSSSSTTHPARYVVPPQSNLDAAFDAVPRTQPTEQQEAVGTTLVTPFDASSSSYPRDTKRRVQRVPGPSSPQDRPSPLTAAFNTVAQLTPEERQALTSMLNSDRATGTPQPPPYAG